MADAPEVRVGSQEGLRPNGKHEAVLGEPVLPPVVDAMPLEVVEILESLALAGADTPAAYAARRLAEMQLRAPIVRAMRNSMPGTRPARESEGASVPPDLRVPADLPAADGVAFSSHEPLREAMTGSPQTRAAVRLARARARSSATPDLRCRSPERGSVQSVDAARIVSAGSAASDASQRFDVEPMPPDVVAILESLALASADTPEARLACTIDEARLHASCLRPRQQSAEESSLEPSRVQHRSGQVAGMADISVSSFSGSEKGPAVRRNGRARLRALIRRAGRRFPVDGMRERVVEETQQLATTGPGLLRGVEPTPAAVLAILAGLDLAGEDTLAAFVARRVAEARLRASMRSARCDIAVDMSRSEIELGQAGPEALGEGRRQAEIGRDGTGARSGPTEQAEMPADPSGNAIGETGLQTDPSPISDAAGVILSPARVSTPNLSSRELFLLWRERQPGPAPDAFGPAKPTASPLAGWPHVLSTPASQARISNPAPAADVANSALASDGRTAMPSATETGSDPAFPGSSRSTAPAIRQAAPGAPVATVIEVTASEGETARTGAGPGPAPSLAAGSPPFQDAGSKPQPASPPATPSTSSGREMGGDAPSSPVASAWVEMMPSPRAPAPAVDPPVDDPADWSDIELGEPEDIEDLLAALEPPSPEVEMRSPAAPPVSRSSVRTAYGLLRDGVDRGWQWLNGGPPDQPVPGTEPENGPTSPSAGSSSLHATSTPSSNVGLERPSPTPAPVTPAASSGQERPAAIPARPSGVLRPEASPAPSRPIPAPRQSDAASPPVKDGRTMRSVPSPNAVAALPPSRSGDWNPGLIPVELRPIAGLYTRYMREHDGDLSHVARIASIRVVLGPDADRLEGFVRRHIGGAQAGDDQAKLFIHQLTRHADPLRGANDKETTKLENAEIRKHGGRPVPARPHYDPRDRSTAMRFLAASFLTARATGNVALEQAVVLIHAERRDGEPASSRHVMECVSVWAAGDPSAAEVFRASQPGEDRLSTGLKVSKEEWRRVLVKIYWNAFKLKLLGGGRDDVGR